MLHPTMRGIDLPQKTYQEDEMKKRGQMAYIRKHYGVPAKRGGYINIHFMNMRGRILSADNGSLWIMTDRGKRVKIHPTWGVEYLG